MLAKSVVAPIDRIKILYQVTSAQFRLRDVPKVAYSIIEKEGWAALWKGNTATMIRVFPYSGIQFMVFDYCKVHFLGEKEKREISTSDGNNNVPASVGGGATSMASMERIAIPNKASAIPADRKEGLSPIESLVSGMIAGTISVLCTYPLDLARAQLAVLRKKKKPDNGMPISKLDGQLGIGSTTNKSKKGIRYVLSSNFRQSGARGLYRGITPTILGILPYSGVAFTINEQSKRQITHIMGRDPTTIERLQCGALSGLFAQTLAYPLEVTRRRMQTIGIVPTSGSESAAVNFTGVSQLKPSVDELPPVETQQQQPKGQIQTTHRLNLAGHASNVASNSESVGQSVVGSSSTNAATTTATPHQQAPRQYHKPPTMMTTMRHLFEEQGVRGFYKGVSMNWVKGPIAFSISFTTFDTIQGWLSSNPYDQIDSDVEQEEKNNRLAKMTISRRLTNNDN